MIALLWACATEPTEPEPQLVPEPVLEREPEAVREPAPEHPAQKTFDEVVRRYEGQLKYCYEKVLKTHPGVEGRIVMGWRVENGLVADMPSPIEDTTGNAELVDCVSKKVRRWQFPAEITGEFSRPFVFRPK